MFYVENPNREKPREPRDSELPLYERKYKDEDLRSNDLDISLRQKAVTTENACNFSLTLSLSLCHSFFNSYTQCHTTSTLSLCNMVTLAHIYTYMTLGLFTNIVFVCLSQHIYTYVLQSRLLRIHPDSLNPVSGSLPNPVLLIWSCRSTSESYPEGPKSQQSPSR